MVKSKLTRHYMKCKVCAKKGELGACYLRFRDGKDTLKLPTKCPYGFTARWMVQKVPPVPEYRKGIRPIYNRNEGPAEIQESWAVRN